MGITPNFTKQDVESLFARKEAAIIQAILHQLRYVGEKFVINARANGEYQDRTGNLRNSVGYITLRNGQIVDENFDSSGDDGNVGAQIGKSVAENIAVQYPKGFILICVAGMHYAAAVESMGYDVITASSLIAKKDLKLALKSILKRI